MGITQNTQKFRLRRAQIDTEMRIMIFLLFSVSQNIDFEELYNTATTSLVQFKTEKDSAFKTLIGLGQDTLLADTTIDFLVSKFDTKSAMERHTLKNIFKEIGKSTIKAIVKKIDYRGCDEVSRSLKQSLWVLGEIGGNEIVEPTARFIDDYQWQIRSSAYTALGKSKSKNALPYIIQGLNDSIDIVRKSAYFALSEVATENEIYQLIQGLGDRFYGVRYASMKALINIGSPAIEPLFKAIGMKKSNDFFIFSALCQLKADQERLLEYLERRGPAIRLAVYEYLDDKKVLERCLQIETNEFLVDYLRNKIINIQQDMGE